MADKAEKISWVKLTDSQHAALKAAAKEHAIPLSSYIRFAAIQYTQQQNSD